MVLLILEHLHVESPSLKLQNTRSFPSRQDLRHQDLHTHLVQLYLGIGGTLHSVIHGDQSLGTLTLAILILIALMLFYLSALKIIHLHFDKGKQNICMSLC